MNNYVISPSFPWMKISWFEGYVGRISKLYLEAGRIREHSSTGSGQTLVETFDLKPPPLFKKPTSLHSQNISSQPTRHVQPFPATHLPNQVATQSCRDITRYTETIMAKSSTSGFINFPWEENWAKILRMKRRWILFGGHESLIRSTTVLKVVTNWRVGQLAICKVYNL